MSNDTPPPPPPPPGTPEPPATPGSDQPSAQPTPPEQPLPPPPPSNPYAPAYGAAAPGGTPAAAVPGGAPGRGMAITSLVLGILALLGVAIPLLNIGSLIMAIVGLVLGTLALRKYAAGKGLPISGVIINAIAAFLALIFVILYAIGFAAWFSAIEEELTPVPPIETTEPADPGDDGATEPDPVDPGDGLFEVTTPDSGPGSFDEPLAIGQTVILTDFGTDTWEVTVDAVDLSADEAVLAVNEFNEPPQPGTQYAVMTLTMTKIAGEPADPWFAIEVEFLSSADTTHTQFDALVVDPEPSLFDLGELSEGETATGNITVLVPSNDVENGRWLVYSYFDSAGFFFQAQ